MAGRAQELGGDFRDGVNAFLQTLECRWRELDGYAVNADRVLADEELQRLATADGRAFLSVVRQTAFEAYVDARDRARAQNEEAERATIELVITSAIYTFVDSLTNIPIMPAHPGESGSGLRRVQLRRVR
jgi:hypothetical protein